MNNNIINICGQTFNSNIRHFTFEWHFKIIKDMTELKRLAAFPNLQSASFANTDLNDEGLKYVMEYGANIQNLNLQNTQISNDGIRHLAKLNHLRILRLKDNQQLTNDCIRHLNLLEQLEDLQIHETSIHQKGLKQLNLSKLNHLIVNDETGEMYYDFLQQLSRQLPNCTILIKGKSEFLNGQILWEKG